MKESELFREFKKKLGGRIGSIVLGAGRNALGIRKFEKGFILFEKGFILKKRKNEIILDRFDLMFLRDFFKIVDKLEKLEIRFKGIQN